MNIKFNIELHKKKIWRIKPDGEFQQKVTDFNDMMAHKRTTLMAPFSYHYFLQAPLVNLFAKQEKDLGNVCKTLRGSLNWKA